MKLLGPDTADGTGSSSGQGGAAAQTGGPSGGELFSSPDNQVAGAGAADDGTPPAAGGATGAPDNVVNLDQPRPSTGLSKEDIQELVKSIGQSVQPAQPQQPQAQPQQYTQEQLEQMFSVFKPTNDLITQLRSEDPQVALNAIITMRDGMLKQAMAMAEYRVQQLLGGVKDELGGQIAPLSEYVTEARATAFRNDFFKANADLEPYEQLVDAVAAKLYQSGGDGFLKLSRDDRMKLFADESRKLVKQLTASGGAAGGNGGGAAGGNAGDGQAGQPGARRMSTLTGGGQPTGRGTGSKPTTGNKNVDAGLSVFD